MDMLISSDDSKPLPIHTEESKQVTAPSSAKAQPTKVNSDLLGMLIDGDNKDDKKEHVFYTQEDKRRTETEMVTDPLDILSSIPDSTDSPRQVKKPEIVVEGKKKPVAEVHEYRYESSDEEGGIVMEDNDDTAITMLEPKPIVDDFDERSGWK